MFTGLIEYTGEVVGILKKGREYYLDIHIPELKETNVKIGDSVSVDGACLTVTKVNPSYFSFFVSYETVERSIVKDYRKGTIVNIELPLSLSEALHGHIVLGHVDSVSKFIKKEVVGDTTFLWFDVSSEWIRFVVEKGSIAINGISLTIADIAGNSFSVAVIPHTYQNTNLKFLRIGNRVNVEFDYIVKIIVSYLDKMDKSKEIWSRYQQRKFF